MPVLELGKHIYWWGCYKVRKLSVNANLNSPLSRPAKIIEFSRFSFVVRTPPLEVISHYSNICFAQLLSWLVWQHSNDWCSVRCQWFKWAWNYWWATARKGTCCQLIIFSCNTCIGSIVIDRWQRAFSKLIYCLILVQDASPFARGEWI